MSGHAPSPPAAAASQPEQAAAPSQQLQSTQGGDERQQQAQAAPEAAAVELAPPLPPLPPAPGQEAAAIVRHSCSLLALPTRVASTALIFLHRVDPTELPPLRLAAACVFLAAKVEEASVRTNDLVNAVAAWQLAATCGGSSGGNGGGGSAHHTAAAQAAAVSMADGGGSSDTAAATGGTAPPAAAAAAEAGGSSDGGVAADAAAAAAVAAFPFLVGEGYAAAKRQLIVDEQLVLRRLRFDIGAGADQPHRHLYVLAHVWGADADSLRAATCLLNDAVAHCAGAGTGEHGGGGSVQLPPATAAAAALHVGAQLAGRAVALPPHWWRATGTSDADMAAACGRLLDLLGVP